MGWLDQTAQWLRHLLAQQSWLEGWHTSIDATPDWALLAVGPVALALFALVLHLASRSDTRSTQVAAVRKPTFLPLQTGAQPEMPGHPTKAAHPSDYAKCAEIAGPPIPAEDDNRSVRVFVSSTFLDMQRERDILVKEVFPKLRARMRVRGVELFEVDLRWGITKEQQERGDTLPTLISEIDRCRPYFIGLIGDRYGWTPPAEALTPELKAAYPDLAEAAGMSITAMEIVHGVLSDDDAAQRALLFERDPNWDWTAAFSDEERAALEPENEAASVKLATLKASLRGKGVAIQSYAQPDDIGAAVENALGALLEERFPDTAVPDLFEQSLRLHRAYARERRGLHVGAASYRSALDRWMEDLEASPLLIAGESGNGKSTLIANWLHDWRVHHPNDILFEHYLGASPDSANPQQIMLRLWEFLNRATGETIDLPDGNAELMDVSSALAERIAQALVLTRNQSRRVLVALDGLDKLSSEQNLRWLSIVPGLKVVASSLDGEAKSAALTRRWSELYIKPLSAEERGVFVVETLKGWGRQLPQTQIDAIIAHPKAGVPLFLKTVLGELRVAATHALFEQVLGAYLDASDLPDLFARMIGRLERDCEPGLVAKALPLIWASRAGLEENEIVAIAGATPLAWATLRNGLGDGVRDQQGRIAFSHDHLRQAVAARYLGANEIKRTAHLMIADRFETREADKRQAEELPYQLRAAEAWERLEQLLLDLDRFDLLQSRGDVELANHWRPLRETGRNPEVLLCTAFNSRVKNTPLWSERDLLLANSIADHLAAIRAMSTSSLEFDRCLVRQYEQRGERDKLWAAKRTLSSSLMRNGDSAGAITLVNEVLNSQFEAEDADAEETLVSAAQLAEFVCQSGHHKEALPLIEALVEPFARVFGDEDENTLALNAIRSKALRENGDLQAARQLSELTLVSYTKTRGPEHRDTLTCMSNLAGILADLKDFDPAQKLLLQLIDVQQRVWGLNDPHTLATASQLTYLLIAQENLEGARANQESVVERYRATAGKDHPLTVNATRTLAAILSATGNVQNARDLLEQTLETATRTMVDDHQDRLAIMSELASMRFEMSDLKGTRELLEQVVQLQLQSEKEASGTKDLEETVQSMLNLTEAFVECDQLQEAQDLAQQALNVLTQQFGKEHNMTLECIETLGDILAARGLPTESQMYQRQLLECRKRTVGPDHPDTLRAANNLAASLRDNGQHSDALEILENALSIRVRKFGENDEDTITTKASIARTLESAGEREEALRLMRQVFDQRTILLGADHPDTKRALDFVERWSRV
ncbi:MAG: tetratricopeptide repeat protein [Hyphomonadaceae bacterium]